MVLARLAHRGKDPVYIHSLRVFSIVSMIISSVGDGLETTLLPKASSMMSLWVFFFFNKRRDVLYEKIVKRSRRTIPMWKWIKEDLEENSE